MAAVFVCCCKTYWACTMYYTALKARQAGQAGQYGRNPPAGCWLQNCAFTVQGKCRLLDSPEDQNWNFRAQSRANRHSQHWRQPEESKLQVSEWAWVISSEQVSFQPKDKREKESFLRTLRDILEFIQLRRHGKSWDP